MSKSKKNGEVSKEKIGGSLPIIIQFGKTKFGSAKDDEKREEVKFIVGSYNPDKNSNLILEALKNKEKSTKTYDIDWDGEDNKEKSVKSNNVDLVGEDNDINSIDPVSIFGDLEL